MSSRTPILDQCLVIRNLLALNDHELEQVINLKQEKEESSSITYSSEREYQTLQDSYDLDIENTQKQYQTHYLLRKELQKTLFDQYNIDLSYRCQFKHKLTVQEGLKEIADATDDPKDWTRFYRFTKDLYLWIGQITGLGHTPCGRCLLDAEQETMTEKKKEKNLEDSKTKLNFMKTVVNLANRIIPGHVPNNPDDFLIDRHKKNIDDNNTLNDVIVKWLTDLHITGIVISLIKNKENTSERREERKFSLLIKEYQEWLRPFVENGKMANNEDFINKIIEKYEEQTKVLDSNSNTNAEEEENKPSEESKALWQYYFHVC